MVFDLVGESMVRTEAKDKEEIRVDWHVDPRASSIMANTGMHFFCIVCILISQFKNVFLCKVLKSQTKRVFKPNLIFKYSDS